MGITKEGESAEEEFGRRTNSPKISTKELTGDRKMFGLHPVEIKKASGGTINQIRPLRGLAVFYKVKNGDWYLISPEEIIEYSRYKKSQHGGPSFLNINISISNKFIGKKVILEEVTEEMVIPHKGALKIRDKYEKQCEEMQKNYYNDLYND